MNKKSAADLLDFHGLAQFCPELLCLYCPRMSFRGKNRECAEQNLQSCSFLAHEMVSRLSGQARLTAAGKGKELHLSP